MRRVRIAGTMAWLYVVASSASPLTANINLEWRPLTQTVDVGDPVGIGLYGVSDSTQDQGFSSAQVIMEWDPIYMLCTGNSTAGAVDLMGSSFLPGDSFGINESNPPTDGDGMWVGMVTFGQERFATPQGTLLTTITFTALAQTPGCLLSMLADSADHPHPPHPVGHTKVLNLQNQNVLGNLGGSATITVVPEPGMLPLLVFILPGIRRESR